MFSALIVDDERLDREGLKSQIDWEKFNITTVETAKSGFEAIRIIESLKPDILITDVKMPGMSGLELAQKATSIVPCIKIIFISGFDNFEFVKNALLINAYEYILKPVDTDELETAIKNVVNARIKEKKTEEDNMILLGRINESKPLLKQKLLRDILYGTVDGETIWRNIQYYGFNILKGQYRILLCELDDFKTLDDELSGYELEAIQDKIVRIIRQIEAGECLAEYIQIEQSRYVIILSSAVNPGNSGMDSISNEVAGRLIEKVRNDIGLSITVGMGGIVDSIDDLHLSYDNGCQALTRKMSMGKGCVLQYFPKSNIKDVNINIQKIVNELMQCIKTSDLNKVYYLIDYLFDSLEAGNSYGSKYVQNCCINIISRIEIVLLEINEKMENIFGENVILWDKLMKFETILDIRQWTKNVFRAVIEYFENKNAKKNRKVISMVAKYIEANYFEELTLKDIAAEFYYSPNYLGAIFKEELGMGFSDYLTEFRMRKAAELLKQVHLKMYEIANQVGYKNISSFINQFKSSYNMTPTEFRERS